VRSERALLNALLDNSRKQPQDARTNAPSDLAILIRFHEESNESLVMAGEFPGRTEYVFQFLERWQITIGDLFDCLRTWFQQSSVKDLKQFVFISKIVIQVAFGQACSFRHTIHGCPTQPILAQHSGGCLEDVFFHHPGHDRFASFAHSRHIRILQVSLDLYCDYMDHMV
jgi:hypothetical protein